MLEGGQLRLLNIISHLLSFLFSFSATEVYYMKISFIGFDWIILVWYEVMAVV
jgi:hypothetical protein